MRKKVRVLFPLFLLLGGVVPALFYGVGVVIGLLIFSPPTGMWAIVYFAVFTYVFAFAHGRRFA